MAPRPKTYGTRRSHVKQAEELVNGTTADEAEPKLKKIDTTSTRILTGEKKDSVITRKAEKQEIPLQDLGKGDEPTSGTPIGEHIAISPTDNVGDNSKTLSPALGPPKSGNGRIFAQDMDVSKKERDLRRTSVRRLVNGSSTSENHGLTAKMSFESIQVDCASPSQAKAISHPDGFIEKQQRCHVGSDTDLKAMPSNLHNIGIWVAQLISCNSDKNSLSTINEPSENNTGPRPGRGIEVNAALDNVEDARMTRGKERRRLQQLKGKEPASDSNPKYLAGSEKLSWPGDATAIERRLKDNLNGKLKQYLFGSPNMADVSNHVTERNACGTLLLSCLVDIGDSANSNSAAAVLKSALDERKDDAPFLSAIKILASSAEVMAFINFLFNKDDAPQWKVFTADEARPSNGVGTPESTNIAEMSGIPSHGRTPMNDTRFSAKEKARNKRAGHKNLANQKRSQEVIKALEAATKTLVQIQQGEAGADYFRPHASGHMTSHPNGQCYIAGYGTAYGPPHSEHPTFGMAYGPPVGANLNIYAPPFTVPVPTHQNGLVSPFVNPIPTHANSYASPYSDSVDQHPRNYASPYANPVLLSQGNGSVLVSSVDNQAKKYDAHENRHDNREVYGKVRNIIRAASISGKRADGAGDQDISIQDPNGSKASEEVNTQDVDKENKENKEISNACDGANKQSVSKKNQEGSNAVDFDETDVDEANKQDGGSIEVQKCSDDATDDDLTIPKTHYHGVAPPSEDHKLFTGERLGDFTTIENIDWLLTVGNGGKVPSPIKKIRMSSPDRSLSSPSSQVDAEIRTEVSMIVNHIMGYKGWRGHPGGTMKQFFYASAEGQRLAAELKRLTAIAKPVVNTIIPLAESQARLGFYRQLESRAMHEKRDREEQERMNRYYGPPIQMQQWGPPPVGYPVGGFPIPPPLPSNAPAEVPSVRRGNVMIAPRGGRDVEEEKKAETYGYPPLPGSRPGGSQRAQKRKRTARH